MEKEMEKLYEKYLSEGNKLKIDTNNLSIYAMDINLEQYF